jgi:hypothetical protein
LINIFKKTAVLSTIQIHHRRKIKIEQKENMRKKESSKVNNFYEVTHSTEAD